MSRASAGRENKAKQTQFSFTQRCAMSVQRKHVESVAVESKLLDGKELQPVGGNGGGGIRTPVP